ncbi:S24 family peptidase [Parapedobacter sp. DT-150]|uniref:S24 family peptidase n=1 Tax=Parapedobacter sp. DT-150 TaxID=3396162 RepID=UPI003F1B2202
MTVEEFYGPLMKSFNNGSAIENNKRKLGKRLAKDIIDYHRINTAYLSSGKGEKTLGVHQYQKVVSLRSIPPAEPVGTVPYYEVNLAELRQPLLNLFANGTPEYYIDYRPFNDCTAYLPVYGDSMYPRFANGEIIAVKEITNLDVLLWGEAYLVITNERANNIVTVKLLYPHQDAAKLILRACNPEYFGDTIVDKTAIMKLYIIKGKITRSQL